MSKRNGLPDNVTEFRDRHGKWRLRYRAKGAPTYYFTGRPGSEEFRAELEACRAGTPQAKVERTSAKTKPGSFAALISMYFGTPQFTGLKASSKKTYRATLERFRKAHGEKLVATIERKHIKAIIGAMADRPAAANKLLAHMHILMHLALDEGWRKDDPTVGIKGYSKKTEGFHTWTEDEIAQYERKHPSGSKARLALSLMLYTGQRRSDARLIGRQHLDNGRIRVKQTKTGAMLSIPIHPKLAIELETAPKDGMTYLLTEFGEPFSAAGIGNKMRDWCDAAELPQCSAHGLRKAAARRMAEAGCTNSQIKAITGHVTDAEVNRYTAAANQITLSDQAMQALGGSSQPTKRRRAGRPSSKQG